MVFIVNKKKKSQKRLTTVQKRGKNTVSLSSKFFKPVETEQYQILKRRSGTKNFNLGQQGTFLQDLFLSDVFSVCSGMLLKNGLKLKAYNILNDCVRNYSVNLWSLKFFSDLLKSCKILMLPWRLQSKRVGKEIYKIPVLISFLRAEKRALRLIFAEAKKVGKTNRVPFWKALFFVLQDILSYKSPLIKQMEMLYTIILDNRVYIKFLKKKRNKRKRRTIPLYYQ